MDAKSPWRTLRLAALAAFALVLVASGCGGEVVAQKQAEDAVRDELEHVLNLDAAEVQCPGDVDVKAGESFDCQISPTTGNSLDATVKVLNEKADLQISGVEGG